MAALAAAELLAAWESMRLLPAAQRPAAILRAFKKPQPTSMGTTDQALLSLHAEHFGGRLDGLARCPSCSTEVELSVPIAELTAGIPAPQPIEPLVIDGQAVRWRLPDDSDLAAATQCVDPEQGALLLVSRCVAEADVAPSAVRELLAQSIAAADPYADISFTLVCPECATGWESTLDIAEFVWVQLRSQAMRLLREVDELARAYGWPEGQIMALSQDRRDSYLELVRGG
jgi:hypothetical protein